MVKRDQRTRLDRDNIGKTIDEYLGRLDSTVIPALPREPLGAFLRLKRQPLDGGPYPGTSIFETANRVLSDLIVLSAADWLLRHPLPALTSVQLTDLDVALGVSHGHDIVSRPPQGPTVIGECFNVAPSFFAGKLSSAKQSLRREADTHKVIAFNSDAVRASWKPRDEFSNEWSYLPIDLESWIREWGRGRAPGAPDKRG